MDGTVAKTHEALHDVFIRMKGEVEVGQRFLQFQHAEEFFVLQRFPHLCFDAVRLL